MPHPPQFSLADLPDGTQPRMYFLDSSFFRDHGADRTLPSPVEVWARAGHPNPTPYQESGPVKFAELNLIVKFGPRTSTAEALCLWAIGKFLQNQVPVPEVYGWDTDGEDVFIYMQLIEGPTLLERYDTLTHQDKQRICEDLRDYMGRLRSVRQSESNQFIGSIVRGPLVDRILDCQPDPGPFPSIKSFHDWLSWLWHRRVPEPEKVHDPWRQSLPDDGPIVFTHGDLHRSNIIVSTTSPARVLAIIDWEQAGWFPEYWEYCKATYSIGDWEEWHGWVKSFLTPDPYATEAWYSTSVAIVGY